MLETIFEIIMMVFMIAIVFLLFIVLLIVAIDELRREINTLKKRKAVLKRYGKD